MAMQFDTVGLNKFKASILKEEFIDNSNITVNTPNYEYFIKKFGEDVLSRFSSTNEEEVDLIRFSDGSKFVLRKGNDDPASSVGGYRWYFAYIYIYHVSANNTRTEVFFYNMRCYQKNDSTGEITKREHFYLSFVLKDNTLYMGGVTPALNDGSLTVFLNSYYMRLVPLNVFLNNAVEYDSDPWSGAGYAGIGGGDGDFDFDSEQIELPEISSIDSVSTGFLQLFSGSINDILNLSKYMWSTSFLDSLVKITSNPIDIIMGLYMYPFLIPATRSKYVRAGNVITNIAMKIPDKQVIEINCGSLTVPSFYGAYLDFEPFSKCEVYLPYCGTFNLSMDDISGKEINVRYRVDLLTGLCVAYIIIDNTVKYNFTGSCAINIPISSRSFENLYNSIIGLVGSMFGGGSFSAPSIGSVSGVVTSGKNQITHGGIASGNAGYLGVQKPYLILNVPRVAIPKGLNKYTGYPIYGTYKLGDLNGYTEVEEIHLENIENATKEEVDRIISLLKGGVIL